jgi:hypothetical protein
MVVFENKMQRRMFEANRVEVAGGYEKMNNEDLNDLYSSPDVIGITE